MAFAGLVARIETIEKDMQRLRDMINNNFPSSEENKKAVARMVYKDMQKNLSDRIEKEFADVHSRSQAQSKEIDDCWKKVKELEGEISKLKLQEMKIRQNFIQILHLIHGESWRIIQDFSVDY